MKSSLPLLLNGGGCFLSTILIIMMMIVVLITSFDQQFHHVNGKEVRGIINNNNNNVKEGRQSSSASNMYLINVGDEKARIPFKHFWKESVGSGHASLCLHARWRDHVLKARDELGFKGIRFHGILSDGMSVVLGDSNDMYYSFFNVFDCYDFLLENGLKPIVEIGFMPELLASNTSNIVFHWRGIVSKPKKYEKWNDLITSFGKALVDRYGIGEVSQWKFEVWNEPNLQNGFWYGTMQDYFELYANTAKSLKLANARIQVGGPVTAFAQYIPQFIEFTKKQNIPLDFISTHEYPTDIYPVERDFMWNAIRKTRKEAGNYTLHYTEWNAGLDNGGGSNFYQDTAYPAPYIIKTIFEVHGLVDIFSFWCVSDIFEEGGQQSKVFSGTYGLITNVGVRKASWRAFELLGQSGDLIMNVETLSKPKVNNTADVYATFNSKTEETMIFVTNWQIPTREQAPAEVMIGIVGGELKDCTLNSIDTNHANAYQKWLQMNSPTYPKPSQLAELNESSKVVPKPIEFLNNKFVIEVGSPSLSVIRCTTTLN